MLVLFKVYLGADQNSPERAQIIDIDAWKRRFRVKQAVIHYKYKTERKEGKTIFERKDYDIALLRIDYPAVDEVNGNDKDRSVISAKSEYFIALFYARPDFPG